jgi:hypothetical protein
VGVTRASSPSSSAVPSTSSVKPRGSGGGNSSVTAGLAAMLALDPRPGSPTTRTPPTTDGSTVTAFTRPVAPTVSR